MGTFHSVPHCRCLDNVGQNETSPLSHFTGEALSHESVIIKKNAIRREFEYQGTDSHGD